ncbi:MAG TPA: hypothetical protein VG274_11615 [Rhizomicrobium sp.]|nr:hypothetical protein [Rhizomicrobium sp.]
MTNRIPVGQTISGAYNFAFTRFLSILAIAWLPYAVFAVIAVGLALLAVPDLPRMLTTHDIDIEAMMGLSRVVLLIAVIGFIMSSMITVGLQRQALGKQTAPVWYYFSLGAPVWRMAGAFFLAGLVIVFIAIVISAACAAIWFAAGTIPGAVWPIRVVAIAAGTCFLIYIATRLLFFLPAVVTAEESIGIERAWILGRGNFWRIFLVWLAVIVPVAIAFWIVSRAVLGPFVPWPHAHMGTREMIRMFVTQSSAFAPLVLVVEFVERVVILGVANGAVANAYLAVAGAPPVAPAAARQGSEPGFGSGTGA